MTPRRTRLIAFIEPWAEIFVQYRVRIGDARMSLSHLTTDALEALAEQICDDFWSRKKRNRENRARRIAAAIAEKMGYVVTEPYADAAE